TGDDRRAAVETETGRPQAVTPGSELLDQVRHVVAVHAHSPAPSAAQRAANLAAAADRADLTRRAGAREAQPRSLRAEEDPVLFTALPWSDSRHRGTSST